MSPSWYEVSHAPCCQIHPPKSSPPCSTFPSCPRNHLQLCDSSAAPGRHHHYTIRNPAARLRHPAAQLWSPTARKRHNAQQKRHVTDQNQHDYRTIFLNRYVTRVQGPLKGPLKRILRPILGLKIYPQTAKSYVKRWKNERKPAGNLKISGPWSGIGWLRPPGPGRWPPPPPGRQWCGRS
jgi:hypothetical protein